MLFSSITFLYFFLPITLLIYCLVPEKGKNMVLLAASFLFYFWGEPKYCLLMAVSVAAGYVGGRLIEWAGKQETNGTRRLVAAVFVSISLVFLLVFKYADFLLQSVNLASGGSIPLLKLTLPVGISFYTFQIISYLVDVSRGNLAAEQNVIRFAAYVTMFPQLIAGPIVRYSAVEKQMKHHTLSYRGFADGSSRFACGLAKKVLIADVLSELVFKLDGILDKGIFFYWVLAAAYTLQIYYDFSGYSDMAIGLGHMLGFSFPENFDYPLISESVTEFWRRWHMTLGGWFRDYVYLPLGGSRVSLPRFIINVLVVWLLSGLWHGAGWNFAVWGLYFGIFLILEKAFLQKLLQKLPSVLRHLYTLAVIIISFTIFRLEDFGEIWKNIGGMFGVGGGSAQLSQAAVYETKSYAVLLLAASVGAVPWLRGLRNRQKKSGRQSHIMGALQPVAAIALLLLATAFLLGSSAHPFLYFRF